MSSIVKIVTWAVASPCESDISSAWLIGVQAGIKQPDLVIILAFVYENSIQP